MTKTFDGFIGKLLKEKTDLVDLRLRQRTLVPRSDYAWTLRKSLNRMKTLQGFPKQGFLSKILFRCFP